MLRGNTLSTVTVSSGASNSTDCVTSSWVVASFAESLDEKESESFGRGGFVSSSSPEFTDTETPIISKCFFCLIGSEASPSSEPELSNCSLDSSMCLRRFFDPDFAVRNRFPSLTVGSGSTVSEWIR